MSCDSLTARGRAAPSGRCASHRCCCHAALARRPVLAPTARPVPSVSGVPLPAAPLVRQSNPPSCHQPSRPQPMPTPLVPPVGRLSQSLAAVLLPWRRGRRPQVAVATEDAQGRAARAGRWGSRGATGRLWTRAPTFGIRDTMGGKEQLHFGVLNFKNCYGLKKQIYCEKDQCNLLRSVRVTWRHFERFWPAAGDGDVV